MVDFACSKMDDGSMPAATSVGSSGRRIFLCHASHDKPAVLALYRRLKKDGFEPWLDEEDLIPGQDWETAIRKAVC